MGKNGCAELIHHHHHESHNERQHDMDTLTQRIADEALEARIADLEAHWTHADTFRHADGSVTVVSLEEYVEPFNNPRELDGNVAHLVNLHRDYRDMDEADAGIDEARERWGDEDERVARYVRMFRQDVALYVPRWEVQGNSQSDWQYGYGYVLHESVEAVGLVKGVDARDLFKQELDVYQLYFAGEVYVADHVKLGAPVVTYGEHGAYVSDYEVVEEACGGFLGYTSLADIAVEMGGTLDNA